ncbi:hypothetical protein [Scytonema sp. NUACC21]
MTKPTERHYLRKYLLLLPMTNIENLLINANNCTQLAVNRQETGDSLNRFAGLLLNLNLLKLLTDKAFLTQSSNSQIKNQWSDGLFY